jgi:hypothetical protein
MADDLILTAERLTARTRGRARQSDLRRAISTAYYALFHAMARDAADLLVGAGPVRLSPPWVQVYRSLEHGFAKNACASASKLGFSQNILECADTFIRLQEERHKADYDPSGRYSRVYAEFCIYLAVTAIASLRFAPRAKGGLLPCSSC